MAGLKSCATYEEGSQEPSAAPVDRSACDACAARVPALVPYV